MRMLGGVSLSERGKARPSEQEVNEYNSGGAWGALAEMHRARLRRVPRRLHSCSPL